MAKRESRDAEAVVASPYWAMNGVNVFSANLVRGLQGAGVPSHVLLTSRARSASR